MVRLGRFGDAIAYLHADSAANHRSVERTLLLSEACILVGDVAEARKYASQVVEHKAATVEQRLRGKTVLAQVLIDAGHAHAAEEIVR